MRVTSGGRVRETVRSAAAAAVREAGNDPVGGARAQAVAGEVGTQESAGGTRASGATALAMAVGALVAAATVAWAGDALGSTGSGKPAWRRTSAVLETTVRLARLGKPVPGPDLRLHPAAPRERLAVTLRLRPPVRPDVLARLEERGVAFWTRGGSPVRVGPVYAADLSPSNLHVLAQESSVVRVEGGGFGGIRPFYAHNLELVQAPDTWPRRDSAGQPLTGHGIVIADIDAGLDVFHPALFRADGGLFPWLDVDGDGTFRPGRDAVDLDGDGQAGPGETLRLIDGSIHFDNSWNPWVENDDGLFQPALDWLYADANGNGRRDFGPEAGFTEDDPTYGERLFLADDVDGDGVLDVGEKVVGLKTSKVRAYYSLARRRARVRGKDLITVPRPVEPSHGTPVAGILVGNETGHHAFTGMAPDAELMFVDQDFGEDGAPDLLYLDGLAWAMDEGADVVLHEYGSPLFTFGDGSSNLEVALDEAAAFGVPQCAAAHNFAGYPVHAAGRVGPGETLTVRAELRREAAAYTRALYGTLRWREPRAALRVALVLPDGREVPLPEADAVTLDDGVTVVGTGKDLSPRGTLLVSFWTYQEVGNGRYRPPPPGIYAIRLHNPGGEDQSFDLLLTDDTGYGATVALLDDATPDGTVAWPGTADSAITVAAYRGNFEQFDDGVPPGGLRTYSGRDPRIDGVAVLDVAAPDDSLGPMAGGDAPFGAFEVFAGTSGALPVVAGAVALMLQADPTLDSFTLTERLRASALRDRQTGPVPNWGWGYGKLAVFQAIFGESPIPDTPPLARLEVKGDLRAGREVVLDASASTDAQDGPDGLEVRFDLGYDGTWDGDFGPEPRLVLAYPEPGEQAVLVEVRDRGGRTARALATFRIAPAPPPPPGGEGEEDEMDGSPLPSDPADTDTMAPQPATESGGCRGCTVPCQRGSGPVTLLPRLVMAATPLALWLRRPWRRGRRRGAAVGHEGPPGLLHGPFFWPPPRTVVALVKKTPLGLG